MKSAGKARSNGLYRHIRTSKEIIRNLLNYYGKNNETNFVLYNVTDLRFKNGDYKILYGQNNSFVRLRAEYA